MSKATEVMRQYLDAFSRQDLDGIRRLFHPKYSYTGGDGRRLEGPEAGVAVNQTYFAAFPDLTLEVQRMHAAGEDTAVTELVARGTHRGEFLGIAPTGRRLEIPVCNVVEVQGGKLLAERDYFDTGLVLQQLGVAAGPASR
jgi:steroid delta-isomerase-like uncharacterized protein